MNGIVIKDKDISISHHQTRGVNFSNNALHNIGQTDLRSADFFNSVFVLTMNKNYIKRYIMSNDYFHVFIYQGKRKQNIFVLQFENKSYKRNMLRKNNKHFKAIDLKSEWDAG